MSRLLSNAAGAEHATRFQCGPDALNYAKSFLDKGMSYQAAARASGVNEQTLREMIQRKPAPVVKINVLEARKPLEKIPALPVRSPAGRIAEVVARVARAHGVTVEDILGRATEIKVVHARHEAFYAVKVASGVSWARIGRIFGRDHSTVLHGVKAYKARASAERKELADARP
jgi:chromosomal replication initiation ATPase DnaA